MRRLIHLVESLQTRVVDKTGQPLICYHAGDPSITHFWPWTHFGTKVAAQQRLSDKKTSDAAFHPVYLMIANPLKVTDAEASDEASMLNAIAAGRYPEIDVGQARREGVIAACENAGYDGLVYRNRMEDRGRLSWVNFHPSQVRRADLSKRV